jgi:hypothetical protein
MILSPWSNCLREGGSSQACKCRRLVEAVQKPIAADEPIGRQVRRCSVFSRVADHLGDAKCIPLFLCASAESSGSVATLYCSKPTTV